MKRILAVASALVFAVVFACLPMMAGASTATTSVTLGQTAYTDLGAGPMLLGARGGDIDYQVADSQPSLVSIGHLMVAGSPPAKLDDVTAHVWARALNSGGAVAIVSAGTGVTGGGAGGGGGSVTQGTSPWVVSGSVSVSNTNANGPATPANASPTVSATMSHANVASLGASLVAKNSPGNLAAFNCAAITGGAAGFCIAYNATSEPSAGALTGSLVLGVCYFDTTSKGCSLTHLPDSIAASVGIVILITTAASPLTYTTGTDTAYIEADYF